MIYGNGVEEKRESFTRSLQVDVINAEKVLMLALKCKSFDDALKEMQVGRARDAVRCVFRYAMVNPARVESKMLVIESAIITERDLLSGVDEAVALANFVRMLCI